MFPLGGLVVEHLSDAPHWVHEGSVDERRLLLVTVVTAGALALLAAREVDDPDDGRLLAWLLSPLRPADSAPPVAAPIS